MGTWSTGNFQNDQALDYLGEVMDSLVEKLEKVVKNPILAEADEPSNFEVMAAVEIITVLCENLNAVPPQPALVSKCQETFLTSWEKSIDALVRKSGFKEERRAVIVASFETLKGIAQEWHS
jgi:predicted secreted protein